ncbi:MAG: hypothetical protein FWE84_03745 [Firmicutes bacterium]|nr:hypothetical protein [Bacillota bacterium]
MIIKVDPFDRLAPKTRHGTTGGIFLVKNISHAEKSIGGLCGGESELYATIQIGKGYFFYGGVTDNVFELFVTVRIGVGYFRLILG